MGLRKTTGKTIVYIIAAIVLACSCICICWCVLLAVGGDPDKSKLLVAAGAGFIAAITSANTLTRKDDGRVD